MRRGWAPERWRQVEAILDAVLDLGPEERSRLLDERCGNDRALRADVDSLLAADAVANGFLDLPLEGGVLLDSAGPSDAPAIRESLEGERFGPYLIVSELGHGGMGSVWLADRADGQFEQRVALKLVAGRFATGEIVRRFLHERQILARLQHPNIACLLDGGVTAEGQPYFVMEYVEGLPITTYCDQRQAAIQERLALFRQVAEAVAYAHRSSVVHRDIKPANILVTADARVKLLDFGIAKLLPPDAGPDQTVTRSGVHVMTPEYAAPEQVLGGPVTPATDVYAMGAVLYELLTGRHAHRLTRKTPGEVERVVCLEMPPIPSVAVRLAEEKLQERRPERRTGDFGISVGKRSSAALSRALRGDLDTIVMTALHKEPERRYASAEPLLEDLDRCRAGLPLRARPDTFAYRTSRFVRRHRLGVTAAVLVGLSLLFGSAGAYFLMTGQRPVFDSASTVAASAAPAIAVLPFTVRGPEVQTWREGMVDLLTTNLDGAAGLRSIDSRTVLATWQDRIGGNAVPQLGAVIDVARRTGARYALMGSAVAIGSEIRLTAEVYAVPSGKVLGKAQVEGAADGIVGLVDQLSIEVLRTILKGQGGELPPLNLARVTTSSISALKSYLAGEVLYRQAKFAEASSAYQQAVAVDSTFALALYRLGKCYGWAAQPAVRAYDLVRLDVAQQYLARAARFVDRLPEREAVLVQASLALRRGSLEGLEPLRKATRQYPDDPEVWYELGETYMHLGNQALVPIEETARAFSRAVELDPGFAVPYHHLIELTLIQDSDSSQALRLMRTYHRLAPGTLRDRVHALVQQLVFGDAEDRQQALAHLDTLPTEILRISARAYLLPPRYLGIRERLLLEMRSRPDAATSSGTDVFFTHRAQGKISAALEDLEHPSVPPGFRKAGIELLYQTGAPIPEEVAERALATERATERALGLEDMVRGLYAADRGRWADYDAALRRVREFEPSATQGADSVTSRLARGAVAALEGYGLWKRGEAEQALRLLSEAQRTTTGFGSGPLEDLNGGMRRWLAGILVELGRPAEAVPYLASFLGGGGAAGGGVGDPWAAYELARVYEDLGRYEDARREYELVAVAWREADPEMRPRLEEVRAALSRLRSVRRDPG